jgi:hypothetical protein
MLLLRAVGRDSSVRIATSYGLDCPGIESRWERDLLHPFRSALGPKQPPTQAVPGLFPGGKAAGAWCWPPTPSCTEVKERVEVRGTPLLPLWAFVAFSRVNFSFTRTFKLCFVWRTHAHTHTHTKTRVAWIYIRTSHTELEIKQKTGTIYPAQHCDSRYMPHVWQLTVYVAVMYMWETKECISWKGIIRSVYVMETQSVFCEEYTRVQHFWIRYWIFRWGIPVVYL